MRLTPKQKRFCQEYLLDLNATQAAIRAGYSAKTAREQASRLLSKVNIQAEVAVRQKVVAQSLEIKAEEVLRELLLLGFANIGHYVTFGPKGVTLKDSAELTREQLACIAEVSETTWAAGRNVRFKLYDKLSALEKLMKHLGLFQKDNEQQLPQQIEVVYVDGEQLDLENASIEELETALAKLEAEPPGGGS